MKIKYNKQAVETVVRRLKRKDAYRHNYLDDLVDSTLRMLGNTLANRGPLAQCKFLLANGWTVREIVKHGQRTRKMIRKQLVQFLVEHKKKRKKKKHDP